MAVPAVNFASLRATPAVTPPAIVLGDDSPAFVAAGAIVEPISAGAPPVEPSICARGRAAEYPVRRVRARSGHPKSSPLSLSGCGRATWTVSWPALTRAEANALRAFFEDSVIAAEGSGGVYGFDLRPDGPSGSLVVVRALGALKTRVVVGGGAADGSDHVEMAADLEVEELF